MAMTSRPRPGFYLIEWLILILVVFFFSRATLLDGNAQQLQQTGEHNESATLPILAEIGLQRYGEIPLWNPYMLTGFPHVGDPINHFWNPVATIPVMIWGGVNGMKVAEFLSLVAAALGQWVLAHVLGVRGIFRLWAGLLFALSGGLVLFWRLGWYELLVGIAWFPWCFAGLWVALKRQDRLSLVLTALALFMVATTGGGYYPLYLGVCLAVMTLILLYWAPPARRNLMMRRAAIIVLLMVGLSAIYWLPLLDGYRYTGRDAPPDYPQNTSQPIPYALFNYVVKDEGWFTADVLGKGVAYGWFYLGALPMFTLGLSVWLYSRYPARRRMLVVFSGMLIAVLAWHANRHTPVQYLYEAIPFLYNFRLPNRLLVVATSPIIALVVLNGQGLLVWARRWWRGLELVIAARRTGQPAPGLSMVRLLNVAVVMILAWSVSDLYQVNQKFGMAPHPRNTNAQNALTWLKEQDDSLYYVNIGGNKIFWDWMAYAYELELPVLNFRYNRRVLTSDEQNGAASPFNAQPKYILAGQDLPQPPNSQLLSNFQGVNIWYQPEVLPYAFSTPNVNGQITRPLVTAQSVRLNGPNQVIVTGRAEASSEHLVVLVSDYPGWRVWVDGERAEMQAVNGFLGVEMLDGEHTYLFKFHPVQYDLGLVVSIATLLFCLWWVVVEPRWKRKIENRPAVSG